jgi:ABC-type nickel/cobalt efflux system permease component RcnA
VLSNLTRWGAYIVMFWLLGIALQLIAQFAFLDIAVRDIMMSIGAFTLARLTEVRQESEAVDTIPARERPRVVA